MAAASSLEKNLSTLSRAPRFKLLGRVERVRGLVIESTGPRVSIGQLCTIRSREGNRLAEVVGFSGSTTLLMALEDIQGLSPGDEVAAFGLPLTVPLSDKLLGRIVNGIGEPIDGGEPIVPDEFRPLYAEAPNPLTRMRVTDPLPVGIRAIDGMLTLGRGQRVGVFAGSGVGKSVLMGMMTRHTKADVVVVGLIGERGREVRDFIHHHLKPEDAKKVVLVSETSDRWPLLRIKGAMTATTIAEYFRDKGLNVLLLIDSITRVCHALREVGLSLNEPPATRGYPPSVFAAIPKLLERSGNSDRGSITAIYTVLVDGDDMNEPVADMARSILDGHIVLSRKLAARHHYPAVDVLRSISRVMPDVVSSDHFMATAKIKEWLAAYEEAEDLISIGAYAAGSRPVVDKAIERMPKIGEFLKQPMNDMSGYSDITNWITDIAGN